MEKITIFCFAASYGVALALELLHVLLARPALRIVSLLFGSAGLLAHTLYAMVHPLSLRDQQGSLLFLAWILAVFYLYGSLHHRRLAWGLFVLPIVLGLIVLGVLSEPLLGRDSQNSGVFNSGNLNVWGQIHGYLLLLAAVGVCVGCVASVMYLVQVRRLRSKMGPSEGIKMLSLERIEVMNRRAILWAFPFLTAGLLVGAALMVERREYFQNFDLKFLSGLGLWVVFAVLLYLRYSVHVRGKQAAWWTLVAFVILLLALISPGHSFDREGVEP